MRPRHAPVTLRAGAATASPHGVSARRLRTAAARAAEPGGSPYSPAARGIARIVGAKTSASDTRAEGSPSPFQGVRHASPTFLVRIDPPRASRGPLEDRRQACGGRRRRDRDLRGALDGRGPAVHLRVRAERHARASHPDHRRRPRYARVARRRRRYRLLHRGTVRRRPGRVRVGGRRGRSRAALGARGRRGARPAHQGRRHPRVVRRQRCGRHGGRDAVHRRHRRRNVDDVARVPCG